MSADCLVAGIIGYLLGAVLYAIGLAAIAAIEAHRREP